MSTAPTLERPSTDRPPRRLDLAGVLRQPLLGPLVALLVAVVVFSALSDTFLTPRNFSLILQQSVVVGILAVGQTLIILTAGIDLSVGAVAVLGTLVLAKLAGTEGVLVAAVVTLVVCLGLGAVNGLLVTAVRLPPFIVTLGTFTAIAAATQLFAGSATYPVDRGVLTALGRPLVIGSFVTTWGVAAMIVVYLVTWYALTQTAGGRHVYAVGGNQVAAQLTGIRTGRPLLAVYVLTGLIAVIAAWAALGRIPNADPNAFQNANLETITAVVIGGTSLFGGRGSVIGTLIGTLIVGVLRNGLTQAGVDSLWQNVATGILVILAVTVDQYARRRNS